MGEKAVIIEELKKFKDRINKVVFIDKFIFFGSRASGKPSKDSDIDIILVSKNFKGKKFRYRAMDLYDYWNLDYPVDFLCYSPEEFNKLKKQITIVKEAVKKGIEI